MPSNIYIGQVMHRRFEPVAYQFKYGVMSLKINIDAIEKEAEHLRWLSLNAFNLYSLDFRDYGARNSTHWRTWANALLAEYGLTEPAQRIDLVCFPRFMGMVFNPLAMWYAYNSQGQLVGVIGEVSNTFGQWHHYVLTNQGHPLNDKLKAEAEKAFHVSPFIGMDCRYAFRFRKPSQDYQLAIHQQEAGKPLMVATQVGRAQALNDRNLLKSALKHPFNTLKVIFLIHWWALKIWLKGGKFHKTPSHLQEIKNTHTEMNLC